MQPTTGQLIAGTTGAEGSDTFAATNAATGAAMEPNFHEATANEIDRACEAAAAAFDDYRSASLEKRARFLELIADQLETLIDTFAERTTAESGLPEGRIRGELGRTTGQLRKFAGVVRKGDFLGVRIDDAEPDVRQYHVPVGPVVVFGASNFPLAFSVAGGDTASALAAGSPVVVKGHPAHPGTSALVGQAIAEAAKQAGMPAGVFSLVQGRGNAVGERLVKHPAIKAVGFTGSQNGGLALAKLAAARPEPIPVYAEMGSVNPMFLLPNTLAERGDELATGHAGSFTLGCGQFCTNPGLVFAVAGDALENFVAKVAEHVEQTDANVMLHAGILRAYEAGTEKLEAVNGVARVASGPAAPGRAQVRLYRTTQKVLQEHPEITEEVFGPLSLIIELEDATAMPAVANSLAGQLTATVHGSAEELGQHPALVTALEKRAGRVLFNGFPTGVAVCDAMVHGGPYPATSDGRSTSVGTRAIERFLRLVCYQDFPQQALPEPLQDANPLGLRRLVNGEWQ